MKPCPIELLAPAGNLQNGMAAINHGADAVYIGGPEFGARGAAGCSLRDIDRLVSYAHQFRVKVYIALNTILTDAELGRAVSLTHRLHDLQADGLIVQDVGLLESGLPPIPLHSSTQMNNRTVEKVQFLEAVGFRQVVLARELSLERIREIRAATSVTLEFFVHGALCVSYSGQCYMSEVMAGRSANRGECAQFCRHKFSLEDLRGNVLEKDRFLLSLRDLDLSGHLRSLIDAGITSFKIEGRLKDENYVKNVTAYYRILLDNIIGESGGLLCRSSAGTTRFDFTPDPERTFHRGETDYYLTGPKNRVAETGTPKSTGKQLGRVVKAGGRWFTLQTVEKINNGDGLCYFEDGKGLEGVRVNRVEGDRIYLKDAAAPLPGAMMYRNFDLDFAGQLVKSGGCRTLPVKMYVKECEGGLDLTIEDEDLLQSTTFLPVQPEPAKLKGAAAGLAEKQLCRCGGTLFDVEDVRAEIDADSYYPAAVFNRLRRQAIDNHLQERLRRYRPERITIQPNAALWPGESVDYLDNISNSAAERFYRRHGVRHIARNRLRAVDKPDCALMTTKYCIRFELGICPNRKGVRLRAAPPLILADNNGRYRISFNCEECEMVLRLEG
jgi:collagenase-like PrtC family protease